MTKCGAVISQQRSGKADLSANACAAVYSILEAGGFITYHFAEAAYPTTVLNCRYRFVRYLYNVDGWRRSRPSQNRTPSRYCGEAQTDLLYAVFFAPITRLAVRHGRRTTFR
ncbi:MAG: hypothetical protein LBH75_08255 [Treponema sp.]|nr:hypothetical protein [Treponema sp.]